jgi:urease accessory protein
MAKPIHELDFNMATWHGKLNLNYRSENKRTVARFSHDGPLRILQSLYPEGDSVCHNVLVHPPSGLVAGDTLDIGVKAESGSHGLITTPGASRFYGGDGVLAQQLLDAEIEDGARLEWLPLENLAYSGCQGLNRTMFQLHGSAELMAWDVTALGLPLSNRPFVQGCYEQHFEIKGVWLDKGRIDAQDLRLLNSPVGLAGHRCLATLVMAKGQPWSDDERLARLNSAREVEHASDVRCGITSPHPQVIVVRMLAPLVEPAMQGMKLIWKNWRKEFWGLSTALPRTWLMG